MTTNINGANERQSFETTAAAVPPAHGCCNSWFASLPEGRQAVLREDKWMLAHAAFDAGRAAAVAVPHGFRVTEQMHVAACKVLTRAHGLDGLPQRMLDAMFAAAPKAEPVPGPSINAHDQMCAYVDAAVAVPDAAIRGALNYIAAYDPDELSGFAPAKLEQRIRAIINQARTALAATPAAPAAVAGLDRGYAQRLIEALRENSDPVSVDAAEEFGRLLAAAPTTQAAPQHESVWDGIKPSFFRCFGQNALAEWHGEQGSWFIQGYLAAHTAAPAAQVAPEGDHDALRCAVGNCTFNGEVTQHVATFPNKPAAVAWPSEPPLTGRWHHGNGVLVSGSIRIAHADFDTNPPDEFRDEVLDWMCATLNAAIAAPTAQAAPQSADENEGMTREQWIEQAMRVYLIAGDTEDEARECAKALCSEQNWNPLQDDFCDPYDAAMSDVEGRGPAPQPAAQQGSSPRDGGA
jgi:hypothetical protein